MADQGHWYKLWCSALDDPSLSNLSNEQFAIWAKLGTYTKKHGTGGVLRIEEPARTLCAICQVVDFEELCVTVGVLPNVRIELQKSSVTGVTNATVTFSNWSKYQGDNSKHRVEKHRESVTAKKRREEKRDITPPKVPRGTPDLGGSRGNEKQQEQVEWQSGKSLKLGLKPGSVKQAAAEPARSVEAGWATEPWGTVERWCALWNGLAPESWMAIRLVDGRRAGLIRSALASFPDEAYWRKAISGIRRAVFLSGPVSPATLAEHNRNPDWFLSEGKDGAVNHVKVYEGRMA